jgi:hypothetical protein
MKAAAFSCLMPMNSTSESDWYIESRIPDIDEPDIPKTYFIPRELREFAARSAPFKITSVISTKFRI